MKQDGLRFGVLGAEAAHLCIDMQNLVFQPESPWRADWAERVLPAVLRLVEHVPDGTIFTRFIPPAAAEDMAGVWQRYYRHWQELTRARIDPELLNLIAPLQAFVPPAVVLDKPVYSPFSGHRLRELLMARQVSTLVISGAETDVCVLATALGAVDLGFRVVLAIDAICSSSDQTHDALVQFYRSRLSLQVELAATEEIIGSWRR
ncbi:cysteine hydrolase [Ferrovibrio sp.]|uniref:cysteine hydrolase n=1 Tax=Ferrovibrio sp. TaxID=1917215 RepID=UPI000CC50383|nr:cysteine hydrolase [Ferrovibrio sp.]PJI37375.1 MAG: cysteine hydrolase [Ferrovibrio sp.]